jgi:hypothetical protein
MSVERHQPQTTMSKQYNENQDLSFSYSKCSSRAKVAYDIQNGKSTKRVVHYLGGTSIDTPFERFFPFRKKSLIVRYERENTIIPHKYMPDFIYSDDFRIERKQHGCFVNNDFFKTFEGFIKRYSTHTHDMWLDFCGMPTDELLGNLKTKVFKGKHSSSINKVYVTFFVNPRNSYDVAPKINKYGKSIQDKAKSLCEFLNENVLTDTGFSCETFHTYMNGHSPMVILKFTNNQFMNKKTKQKNPSASAINYAIMRKHYNDEEIASLWGCSMGTIAAYKAWATMMGVTPNPKTNSQVSFR